MARTVSESQVISVACLITVISAEFNVSNRFKLSIYPSIHWHEHPLNGQFENGIHLNPMSLIIPRLQHEKTNAHRLSSTPEMCDEKRLVFFLFCFWFSLHSPHSHFHECVLQALKFCYIKIKKKWT